MNLQSARKDYRKFLDKDINNLGEMLFTNLALETLYHYTSIDSLKIYPVLLYFKDPRFKSEEEYRMTFFIMKQELCS